MPLTAPQGRVVGCLVEKQLATPQQYPLTLNALVMACNQASNREPVVGYADREVQGALDELKEQRLVRFVLPSHGRSVVRYRHVLDEVLGLDQRQLALLALLLLRGPQTVAELRARAGRLVPLDRAEAVEHDLGLLADRDEPLVERRPRRPGQKEERWATLLADLPKAEPEPGVAPAAFRTEPGAVDGGSADEHPRADESPAGGVTTASLGAAVAALRGELDALREETAALRAALAELRDSLGG